MSTEMTPRLFSKLTAPVAALATLLLAFAIGSAWYVRNLQQSISGLLANNVVSVRAAQELEISIREIRTQFDRYLITQDEIHLKSIPQLKERTDEALSEAEQTASTPLEHIHMRRVRQGYQRFFAEYDKILRNRDQWKYSKIIELIDLVLQKEILDPAHEYLRINEGVLAQVTKDNQESSDHITLGLIVLGLCGAIGGVLTGTMIATTIRRSIMQTEAQVRQTTEELSQAIHPDGDSGTLSESNPLEQMTVTATAVLQRLRQTERDALRAEQLAWVGQMAAGIAHEIRNPLMAIKLIVQTATERRHGHTLKPRDFQVLEEEISRVEKIVNEFLDFARPHRMDTQWVNVNELVARSIEPIQNRAELQRVEIDSHLLNTPVMMAVDPHQIHQVLFNLLLNALDAQPTGGYIAIHVGTETTAANTTELVINVVDGGPGISESIRERLFEPFVSTKESGMGLGLSICRRIAESHGGTLTMKTSTAGSIFTLRLPMRQPAKPANNQPTPTYPHATLAGVNPS